MFYIIETIYTGPNQDSEKFVDADRIEISKQPAHTNMSNEVRTVGWCGTTNDWSTHAHGEYSTLEEARAAVAATFGEVRSSTPLADEFESDDENVVEVYKRGKYEPMSREATADWSYSGFSEDIDANTTDERIEELASEYEATANSEGYTLDSRLKDYMLEFRNEKHTELEEA